MPIALLIPPLSRPFAKATSPRAGYISSFFRPITYGWRKSYHKRDYNGALDYARKALGLTSTMTLGARLEALRFSGLSCARLGLVSDFDAVVKLIEALPHRRAKGHRHFLVGFFSRLRGEMERAEEELTQASRLLRGSIDVQRELIGVLLARRRFEEALSAAEELVNRAGNNAYVLDGYIQAKIATAANAEALDYDSEFIRRLDQLRDIGDGPGLSFYSLRRVDLALRKGNHADALTYSARAIDYTPKLPAARAARARALIADGDYDRAWGELRMIEDLGANRNRVRDGLEKLILYRIRFEYNLAKRRFDLCKSDVENMGGLDQKQAKAMKMDLVHTIVTSGGRVEPDLARWLKS